MLKEKSFMEGLEKRGGENREVSGPSVQIILTNLNLSENYTRNSKKYLRT